MDHVINFSNVLCPNYHNVLNIYKKSADNKMIVNSISKWYVRQVW